MLRHALVNVLLRGFAPSEPIDQKGHIVAVSGYLAETVNTPRVMAETLRNPS